MFELTIAVVTVVLVSATCSMFEAVLYSVPISHIEGLVQAKKESGKLLQQLRQNVDEPISAILSLNTIANTAGAAVAGSIAAQVLGTEWVWVFSALFTMAILFFSEVIPKTVGVVYSRPLSEMIARPLQILVLLFKPLIWLLGLVTKVVAGKRTEGSISEAELVIMANMGVREGVIEAAEGAVIRNILSLEDKTVRQVMTPRTVLFTLDGEQTVDEARREKGTLAHSRIPVYINQSENIVGIVHRHDIFAAAVEDQLDTKIEALMRPVHFVLDATPLDQVLTKFLEQRQPMFIVIGEFGDLTGVITLEDVLEEILGQEIVDEFDVAPDMRELAKIRRRNLLNRTLTSDEEPPRPKQPSE